MRRPRAALALCVSAASLLVVGPAEAHQHSEEREEPAGQATTCHDVLEGEPAYEVKHSTDPSSDDKVRSGDAIAVRMTWKADDFTDAPLYDILSCVTVEGVLDETLGVHEEDAPNRGEYTHRFTIPAGLPSGAEVCVRGAIAGDGNGYFERNLTDDECLTTVESPETDPAPDPQDCADSPGSPECAEDPDSPECVESPGSPDSPGSQECVEDPDSPECVESPGSPDSPGSQECVEDPESPECVESPGSPECVEDPGSPDCVESPGSPACVEDPGSPDCVESPGSPGCSGSPAPPAAPAPPAPPAPPSVAPETETAPAAEPAPREGPEVGDDKFTRAGTGPATGPQLEKALPKTGSRREVPMGLAGMLIALGGAFVAINPRRR